MKKFLLLTIFLIAGIWSFSQTCPAAKNITVTENPSQGLIGIGWQNSTGDYAQSVYINGVAYKDGNSNYSVWTSLSFISTECAVWQSLGQSFTNGQTVTVTVREYCTYPISTNYTDASISYTFQNNMCGVAPIAPSNKGKKK